MEKCIEIKRNSPNHPLQVSSWNKCLAMYTLRKEWLQGKLKDRVYCRCIIIFSVMFCVNSVK